jgi:hypothetical protein
MEDQFGQVCHDLRQHKREGVLPGAMGITSYYGPWRPKPESVKLAKPASVAKKLMPKKAEPLKSGDVESKKAKVRIEPEAPVQEIPKEKVRKPRKWKDFHVSPKFVQTSSVADLKRNAFRVTSYNDEGCQGGLPTLGKKR